MLRITGYAFSRTRRTPLQKAGDRLCRRWT